MGGFFPTSLYKVIPDYPPDFFFRKDFNFNIKVLNTFPFPDTLQKPAGKQEFFLQRSQNIEESWENGTQCLEIQNYDFQLYFFHRVLGFEKAFWKMYLTPSNVST